MIVPTKIILTPSGEAFPNGLLKEEGKKQAESMALGILQNYTLGGIYHSGIKKAEESAHIARDVFAMYNCQIPVSINIGLCHEEVFEDFFQSYDALTKEMAKLRGKTVQEALEISLAMRAGRDVVVKTVLSIAKSLRQGSAALCFSHPFYLELAAALDEDPIFCGIKPGSAIVYSVMWNDIVSSKLISMDNM